MWETVVTVLIFLIALFFFARWLWRVHRGDSGCGCGCGGCGKKCADATEPGK